MNMLALAAPVLGIVALLFARFLSAKVSKQDAGTDRMKEIAAFIHEGAQAFLMASRNPARAIGLDDEIGTIEEGKLANLVFVDDVFNVKKVILGGKVWEA